MFSGIKRRVILTVHKSRIRVSVLLCLFRLWLIDRQGIRRRRGVSFVATTARSVLVYVRLLEIDVWDRHSSTALFLMFRQPVYQTVRLFPSMVLLISQPSSAILIPLVRVPHVCRRVLILVIFRRAVLGRSYMVGIEIEIGTASGESRDCGIARGVGFPEIEKGLVPRVDKYRSVKTTPLLSYFHILSASSPLRGQIGQCRGAWVVLVKNGSLDMLVDRKGAGTRTSLVTRQSQVTE